MLNHFQPANPTLNIDSPGTFGVITDQANTPRQMEFGLRLFFYESRAGLSAPVFRRRIIGDTKALILRGIQNVSPPWPPMHCLLLLIRVRANFGLALSILQISEFLGCSPGNVRCFAAGLKAGEVRPIAPGKRSAQPLASGERSIMHYVDQRS